MKIISLEVGKLSNDPANARKHNDRNIESIIASLRRFGQQKPIVIDKSSVVRAGNGTLEAARRLGWDKIDCVVTELESSDATAYSIADNRTAELAEWDTEVLAAELESLQSDGLLEAAGFTDEELAEMLQANESSEEGSKGADGIDRDTYTAKIVAPIYEPKGECPAVDDLYDRTKTAELMADIEAAKLPENISKFLFLAAERHTAFHFRNIAEFYCHASAKVQDLMERSGLVIIDFEKAIEYGFVHMTERLAQLADLEESDNGDA